MKIRDHFRTASNAIEAARTAHEVYSNNKDLIHSMSAHSIQAAQWLSQEGMGGVRAKGVEVLQNPDVQDAALKVGRGAVAGALQETGVVRSDGGIDVLGATKAVVGLKTGTTYAKAARGAFNGGRREARAQWASNGEQIMSSVTVGNQYGQPPVYSDAFSSPQGTQGYNPFAQPAGSFNQPPQPSNPFSRPPAPFNQSPRPQSSHNPFAL